jgi:hypothetical protein
VGELGASLTRQRSTCGRRLYIGPRFYGANTEAITTALDGPMHWPARAADAESRWEDENTRIKSYWVGGRERDRGIAYRARFR